MLFFFVFYDDMSSINCIFVLPVHADVSLEMRVWVGHTY